MGTRGARNSGVSWRFAGIAGEDGLDAPDLTTPGGPLSRTSADRATVRWVVGFDTGRWPLMAPVKAILTLRADKLIILETEIGYCLACYEPTEARDSTIVRFYREREKGGLMVPSPKAK
jgi:hypothetical protein